MSAVTNTKVDLVGYDDFMMYDAAQKNSFRLVVATVKVLSDKHDAILDWMFKARLSGLISASKQSVPRQKHGLLVCV